MLNNVKNSLLVKITCEEIILNGRCDRKKQKGLENTLMSSN